MTSLSYTGSTADNNPPGMNVTETTAGFLQDHALRGAYPTKMAALERSRRDLDLCIERSFGVCTLPVQTISFFEGVCYLEWYHGYTVL